MAKEYIIWGKAPGSDDETLLVSEKAEIATRTHADRVVELLTEFHGCRDCRVSVFIHGSGAEVINMFRGAVA
jgi:hypothetical protein